MVSYNGSGLPSPDGCHSKVSRNGSRLPSLDGCTPRCHAMALGYLHLMAATPRCHATARGYLHLKANTIMVSCNGSGLPSPDGRHSHGVMQCPSGTTFTWRPPLPWCHVMARGYLHPTAATPMVSCNFSGLPSPDGCHSPPKQWMNYLSNQTLHYMQGTALRGVGIFINNYTLKTCTLIPENSVAWLKWAIKQLMARIVTANRLCYLPVQKVSHLAGCIMYLLYAEAATAHMLRYFSVQKVSQPTGCVIYLCRRCHTLQAALCTYCTQKSPQLIGCAISLCRRCHSQ